MKREASGTGAEFADRQRIVVACQPPEIAPEREHDFRIGIGDGRIAGDVMRHFALSPGLDAAPGEIGVLQLPNVGTGKWPPGLDDKPLAAVRPWRACALNEGGVRQNLCRRRVHRSIAIFASLRPACACAPASGSV